VCLWARGERLLPCGKQRPAGVIDPNSWFCGLCILGKRNRKETSIGMDNNEQHLKSETITTSNDNIWNHLQWIIVV
jgi:hypothetical protein